jgi:hypothetical protein
MNESKMLIYNYDNDHDVLYISIGKQKPSYCDQDLSGILIRKAFASDKISGVTILDFTKKTTEQLQTAIPLRINFERIYERVFKNRKIYSTTNVSPSCYKHIL